MTEVVEQSRYGDLYIDRNIDHMGHMLDRIRSSNLSVEELDDCMTDIASCARYVRKLLKEIKP